MTIESLRNEIDNIDAEIVSLLNKRYNCCIAIGELKKNSLIQVLDSSREQKIIDRLSTMSEYPGMVETLWPAIMEYSRNLQFNLKN